MSGWLDQFWGQILSRDADHIQAAFEAIQDETERAVLIQHLHNMTTEDGWAEPQQQSAQAALNIISTLVDIQAYLE